MEMVIAHVKWFIESPEGADPYFFSEPSVLIWLGIGALCLCLAYLLNRWIKKPSKAWKAWANASRSRWTYVFQFCLGLSLVFAAVNQVALVPHYTVNSYFIPALEVLAAILLMVNRFRSVAGALVLVTYLGSMILYGAIEVLDYINVVGMGLFVIFESKEFSSNKWCPYSLDVLRVTTGLALIVLAFSEKLLSPGKSMALLSEYDLNFMSALGFDYSDRLFILSAGSVEMIFGLIMILGWIPRVNTLALACFLVGSNIFFFTQGYFQEGLTETMGHLPIIATALLLIIYGKSFRDK